MGSRIVRVQIRFFFESERDAVEYVRASFRTGG